MSDKEHWGREYLKLVNRPQHPALRYRTSPQKTRSFMATEPGFGDNEDEEWDDDDPDWEPGEHWERDEDEDGDDPDWEPGEHRHWEDGLTEEELLDLESVNMDGSLNKFVQTLQGKKEWVQGNWF